MERTLRIVVLGSVAVGAFLAVVALLGADFVGIEKAIATSFIITGAAVAIAAAAATKERPRPGPTHLAGGAAAAGAAAMMILALWVEIGHELYWRLVATVFIIPAVMLALVNVLALSDLPERRRWVRGAADVLAAMTALFLIVQIWLDEPFDAAWAQRLFGILAVLLAAAAVAVPVLHRAARVELAAIKAEPAFCPFCGRESAAPLGSATSCPHCHNRYSVTVSSRSETGDKAVAAPV